ncbi:MAG: DUF1622 domain-containing protein [Treponemataceae bacterium]|nr:DUF1622 domain-containing protein [Treponemataceae bacterium]
MNIVSVVELVISVISVIVVIYGALIAFFAIVKTEFLRFRGKYSILRLRVIRADLGTYLLLGLELLIAADVLKTILEPGMNELLILGGIVILRTLLSFFLNKEIQEIDNERKERPELFENIGKS